MPNILKSLLILLTLTLSACGFHLREPISNSTSISLPTELRTMYVATNTPNDPFVQQLNRMLTANGINLVNDPSAAKSILNILNISTNNTMVSNGGVNVSGFYTVYVTATFSLTLSDGTVLIPPTTVQQSQNFSSSASQVLSGSSTAQQLAQGMQQQLAQSLLNQLAQVKIDNSQVQMSAPAAQTNTSPARVITPAPQPTNNPLSP